MEMHRETKETLELFFMGSFFKYTCRFGANPSGDVYEQIHRVPSFDTLLCACERLGSTICNDKHGYEQVVQKCF